VNEFGYPHQGTSHQGTSHHEMSNAAAIPSTSQMNMPDVSANTTLEEVHFEGGSMVATPVVARTANGQGQGQGRGQGKGLSIQKDDPKKRKKSNQQPRRGKRQEPERNEEENEDEDGDGTPEKRHREDNPVNMENQEENKEDDDEVSVVEERVINQDEIGSSNESGLQDSFDEDVIFMHQRVRSLSQKYSKIFAALTNQCNENARMEEQLGDLREEYKKALNKISELEKENERLKRETCKGSCKDPLLKTPPTPNGAAKLQAVLAGLGMTPPIKREVIEEGRPQRPGMPKKSSRK